MTAVITPGRFLQTQEIPQLTYAATRDRFDESCPCRCCWA